MTEKSILSLAALEEEAVRFAASLMQSQSDATLVTLSGALGAGKTAFVQAAAKAFGVAENVTSPTFVLEKIYALPDKPGGFTRLVHIDAYRLSGGSDLAPLGFAALMADRAALVLLEWPEKVRDALPAPAYEIQLEALPDGARTIRYA
jgi:tRNA threonylcarbamoyladenosine biosynthesis protein TsaE